jgi:hypothetical protein
MVKEHCDRKRCGRGCTEVEYWAAVDGADTLVQHLGASWTAELTENLGWFYSARSPCGRVWVSPSGAGFSALLGKPHSHAGRWHARGKTPKAAVRAVVEKGNEALAEVTTLLEGL